MPGRSEPMDSEPSPGKPLHRGAEAQIRAVDWLGLPARLKERDPKSYRPKALDDRLRRERTRTEARLLVESRRVGVRTPILYDLDLPKHRIVMEELPGSTLKQLLEESPKETPPLLAPVRAFGRALGTLHAAAISHGDLTSSNVLYPDGANGPPAFIDLSMGERSAGVEALGIDLHLVEEDLKSLHPKGTALVREFHAGYQEGNPGGHAAVRKRAKEIRGRVRYA
jgi:Kae1-associated kinase Bud32